MHCTQNTEIHFPNEFRRRNRLKKKGKKRINKEGKKLNKNKKTKTKAKAKTKNQGRRTTTKPNMLLEVTGNATSVI